MGTRTTVEVSAPTNTREWLKLTGEVAADLLNRRRELPEVHAFAKLALSASEQVHSETRRALTNKALGQDIKEVGSVPTA